MDKKSKPSRENSHACFTPKSNTNLNTARLNANAPKPDKGAKPKVTAEPSQPVRNFRFGPNAEQNAKKTYRKNSDKTIKPPEKQFKQLGNIPDGRSAAPVLTENGTLLLRGCSQIANRISYFGIEDRSASDNFEQQLLAPFKRVDTKAIEELEKRIENLQSILLRKIEILKRRNPDKVKKEYKFIAVVVNDECRLIVKESDAKCFPSFLPAKSMEDLNRKASDFFMACLLSFVDKLRLYLDEGRSINCKELYEDLKQEESDYCNALQDWIFELCEDADKTLVPVEKEAPVVQLRNEEAQTEDETNHIQKNFDEQDVQTDELEDDLASKNKDLTAKMDNLRLKNYELRDELVEQKENFLQEIEQLKKKHREKLSDLMDSWQKEICEKNHNEEVVSSERKMNEDLSQQVVELRERLNELMDKHEEVINQRQKDEDAKVELEKLRAQLQQVQNENLELQELKSHFLKKLDQRYARIELQDKEIKLQKRTIQTKNDEIEQLKKQFDAKAKENRQNKESLEARNKLIDHLRNAVEIDQKKIREYEILLESKTKSSEPVEEEQEPEREGRVKRIKSRTAHGGRLKNTKKNAFDAELVGKNNEETHGLPQKHTERPKKKDFSYREQDTAFDIKAFQEVVSADNSSEVEKSPIRNIRPRKRTRDIIVKKYDV